MEKATLAISLPRTMKDDIAAKLREGWFSTPSEYIRSLIRDEQDLAAAPRSCRIAAPSREWRRCGGNARHRMKRRKP